MHSLPDISVTANSWYALTATRRHSSGLLFVLYWTSFPISLCSLDRSHCSNCVWLVLLAPLYIYVFCVSLIVVVLTSVLLFSVFVDYFLHVFCFCLNVGCIALFNKKQLYLLFVWGHFVNFIYVSLPVCLSLYSLPSLWLLLYMHVHMGVGGDRVHREYFQYFQEESNLICHYRCNS